MVSENIKASINAKLTTKFIHVVNLVKLVLYCCNKYSEKETKKDASLSVDVVGVIFFSFFYIPLFVFQLCIPHQCCRKM